MKHLAIFDSIIIGAGAAGLMCGQLAGQRGKKVLILDHSTKLAEKIRISGGGRCNFTNIYTKPECYISANPYFCISALSRYTPQHFTELLDKYNISYHEKTLGQLFCNNSAEDIINLLDQLCNSAGVIRKMGIKILNVNKSTDGFEVITDIGIYKSETLVIASGGLSIPQIGATGFGYNIAKQFQINVITPEPALVPLTLHESAQKLFTPLAGNSFFSQTQIDKIKFQEKSLITHRGLSGPAILQISSYWRGNKTITINMLPDLNISNLINQSRSSNKLLSNFLNNFFSERLSLSICSLINLDKQLSQLNNNEIKLLHETIHSFQVKPSGTLGFKKAEVTRGGIDTKNLLSKSLMSNTVDGLFFIGEVVDVTGWLGGYNFQWAWASAYASATSL